MGLGILPQNRVARKTMLGNMADGMFKFDWRWVGLLGVGLVALSTLMCFLKDKKRENGEARS